MFRIKICGVTNFDDAVMALDLGTQAIGLNFYSGSKRFVSTSVANQIAAIIPNEVWRVGVFVNASADEIAALAKQIPRLSAVQLHGDEPPQLLSQISPELKIVRAYRCGQEGLAPLADYLAACRKLGRTPDAVLIDSKSTNDKEYGGTGIAADWQRIANERELLEGIPFILAGGLTPANVARAIEAARPDAVDVASGVEDSSGRRDAKLMDTFIEAAAQAFSA